MKKENSIFEKLKEKNYKISTAESVTGGLIASTLINVSGISEYLKESYIVYSDESKIKTLNVKEDTINKYSVVSKEVIKEMLDGLQNLTKSEIVIATSGYAESKKKSFYGIKIKNEIYICNKIYFGERNEIRKNICEDVFNLILEKI